MTARNEHFLRPLLARDAGAHWLVVRGRPAPPLATAVEAAFDSASRKRGLLGRSTMPADTALVIAPCSAIHTFGMQFAIDAIFTARDGRVLKIARDIPSARLSASARAFAVVEMAAGSAGRHGLNAGDYLEVVPAD